jgi:hypothetical protein
MTTPAQPPLLLTDDTAGAELESAAGEIRATAFRAQRMWHATPLLWTITRETLYYWLRTPAPRLPEAVRAACAAAQAALDSAEYPVLLQRANDMLADAQSESGPDNSYYRNAIIILYLAAHQSADWQSMTHDRRRFLNAVEAWADDHIQPSEMLALSEVTNQLQEDAAATQAIHRPKSSRGADEMGN